MQKPTPDFINGLFEFAGSLLVWLNVRALYIDKEYKGVRIGPVLFFFVWGFWNSIVYYPALHQWISWLGGVSLSLANLVWVVLMFHYHSKNKKLFVKDGF